MTDEELIAALGKWGGPPLTVIHAAAKRIKQLVKQLDETHDEAMVAREGQLVAEAKLAKAVDALREIAGIANEPWSIARAALAELEKTE